MLSLTASQRFIVYRPDRNASTSELLVMVIRVGVIGLSARAKTSWASSAHLPYLQASGGKYVIIALCNSSVSAAESAIEAYNLPASTKAYGSYFSELILPRGYCDCVVRHVLEARGHIYPQDLSCGSRSDLEKVMLTSESVKGNPQDLAEDPEVRGMVDERER